jgi:hypothetical protein
MEKVLRAMDVIPPFCPDGTQSSRKADPKQRVSSQPQTEPPRGAPGRKPNGEASGREGSQAESKTAVPQFDLGEKILAEQRRMTARKRRAPGTSEARQDSSVHGTVVPARVPLAALSGDDLVQLQRIVAEIVAGDIERLCTGPARVLN